MDKVIYIVRHGQTEFNKKKIVQGSGVNSSLNDMGQQQASALFDAYKEVPFELVFTSALKRTQETAQHFIDQGTLHIKDADIDEICWGIHEGKSSDSVLAEDYKRLMAQWKSGDYTGKIEEGESAQELANRLGRFLAMIKQRPEKNILVLTHGRSIRCLMCLVEGKPLKYMDTYHHHNTGVYKVVQKGTDLELFSNNNTDHLKELMN